MKKIVIAIILTMGMAGGYAAPFHSFAEQEIPHLEVPDTLQEAKEEAGRVGEDIASELPGVTKEIFANEVLPVWRQMLNWTKEVLWEQFLLPPFKNIWGDIMALTGKEVERRTPIIKQELEKEKQELKEELQKQTSKAGNTLWERFKALFEEK